MKTKILAAWLLAATCIALSSCDLLFGKTKNDSSIALEGKWVVDRAMDSRVNHKNDIGLLLLAMPVKDSGYTTAEFLPDGLLIVNNDSMHYYLDTTIHTVFVKEDSTVTALSIQSLTDSSLQLYAAADSLYLSLKRK